MVNFTKHDTTTAPEESAVTLSQVEKRYGFIPNIASYIAESPVALNSLLSFASAFDGVSLSTIEQQVVLLTVSSMNECSFCKTFHAGMSKMNGLDESAVEDLASGTSVTDPKLKALQAFTRQLVNKRGWVSDNELTEFIAAGYNKAQVFEVIMGVALKTFTNYCNHVAKSAPNEEIVGMAGRIFE